MKKINEEIQIELHRNFVPILYFFFLIKEFQRIWVRTVRTVRSVIVQVAEPKYGAGCDTFDCPDCIFMTQIQPGIYKNKHGTIHLRRRQILTPTPIRLL